MSVYRPQLEEDVYAYPTIVQNGSISDLSYVLESGDMGSVVWVWIIVVLIICGIGYSIGLDYEREDEAAEAKKASKKNDGRKNRRRKKESNSYIGGKQMIKILFVCHGNICRSTMAQSVFQYIVDNAGMSRCFEIDSAATSREEIGNPPHSGTVGELRRHNIPVVPHRARQLTKSDEEYYDYLIGMDSANIRNMQRIVGSSDKIYKLLTFAGSGRDVADPWYTGDFEQTYADVRMGCEKLLEWLSGK